MAELTNVAQTGNGFAAGEFAGGDILLLGVVNPLDQVRMYDFTADSPSKPAAVMRLSCIWAFYNTGTNVTECRPRRSGLHPGGLPEDALTWLRRMASG